MQKSFRSFAESMILPVSVSFVLLLSGCGGTIGDKETDEAKQYEAQMALDQGDWNKAIAMLEKDCAGYNYSDCQLNLGSAYMGKAGMDIIYLGENLIKIDANSTTDAERDTQTMTLLFDIIFNEAVAQGAAIYKNLLPLSGAECNSVSYDLLTDTQKQACISVNPILLQELLADDDTAQNETLSVDIETIAEFKDVLGAVIPGITTSEIVSILDDSTPDATKDINNNSDIDSMEATDCAIKAYNVGGNTNFTDTNCISGEPSVSATDLGTIAFTHADYSGITIYGVDVNVSGAATSQADANFTRLVTETASAGIYTSVTTSGYCGLDGETTCTAGSANCYPCPVVDEDGNLETLSGTVTDVLNNDALLTSIAIMSDSDETKTSDEKVTDFKEEVCYADYPTNTVYVCEPGTESDPVISQDALLEYMAR